MSIPKEPRALMIQLMYLVLTAMLALNITREVLNAFMTINDSIVKSNTTVTQKNEDFYRMFDAEEAKPEEADRVKPWNDKAKKVKALSEEMYSYLESLKDTIVNRAGGYIVNERTGKQEPKSMEDIDVATKYFVEEKHGDELKSKLEQYINGVLADVDDPDTKKTLRDNIPLDLGNFEPNDENPKGDWSFGTFNNVPVVAINTILSKFQSDVKNAESGVVEYFFSKVNDSIIKIDEYMPVAVANTGYALPGEEITATITLAAYSRSVNPTISSNRGAVKVENGVGTLKFTASGTGKQTITGNISMPFRGQNKSYPWTLDYYVGSTGGSMQLDKMNVFYIGVPNPVTVAASGYDIDDVTLEIPESSKIEPKGKGQFDVWVTKQNPKEGIVYNIKGKNKSGGYDQIYSSRVRVKYLPDPVAMLNKLTGGNMSADVIRVQKGPYAFLDSDFDAKFNITEFQLVVVGKDGFANPVNIKGTLFNDEARALLGRARPGDMVLIRDIKAVGPDKRTRNLNSLTFTLL